MAVSVSADLRAACAQEQLLSNRRTALEGRVENATENYKETFPLFDCGGGRNHLLHVLVGRERERRKGCSDTLRKPLMKSWGLVIPSQTD